MVFPRHPKYPWYVAEESSQTHQIQVTPMQYKSNSWNWRRHWNATPTCGRELFWIVLGEYDNTFVRMKIHHVSFVKLRGQLCALMSWTNIKMPQKLRLARKKWAGWGGETGIPYHYWNWKEAWRNAEVGQSRSPMKWVGQGTSSLDNRQCETRFLVGAVVESQWARALCCQGKGSCMWPPKETSQTEVKPASRLSSSSGQPAAHQELGSKLSVCNIYVDGGKWENWAEIWVVFFMICHCVKCMRTAETGKNVSHDDGQRSCKVTGRPWDTYYVKIS